jgi:serine/threonine protein kinase
MNANTDKLEQTFSEQLTDFAQRLQKRIADEELLDDIHEAIHDLLMANAGVEADIRRILTEQYRAGNLRSETFELVRKMLERMVTEHVDTAPEKPEAPKAAETPPPIEQAPPPPVTEAPAAEEKIRDPFVDTAVIEAVPIGDESGEDRLQPGSVLRDRFLLREKISGGSMGVVYKAMDRRLAEADGLNPTVAIKVLTPELSRNADALRALQQEAAKGRCLSHPNIVRFIDLDREDELYFIVMEWLEGRSLASILDSSNTKKIDKDTALDIVRQVAKALDYAHMCGVVHADVKPGNIMVSPNGEVKLFDFGIARVRQKQSDGRAGFDPGVLGAVTEAYSSMQVLTGEEPVASDDVFSLGCLTYRLIAGYRVFGPRNAAEAAEAGMEPQRPQSLNDSEWAALKKALAYSRVARFATPREFVEALSAKAPLSATQPLAQIDAPREQRRSHLPGLFAAVVLAGGLYGLYHYGFLDQILPTPGAGVRINTSPPPTNLRVAPPAESDAVDTSVAMPTEQPLVETVEEEVDAMPADDAGIDETRGDEAGGEVFVDDEIFAEDALVDFSLLPPPTVEIPLAFPGRVTTELDLTLKEDDPPAIVEFVRNSNIAEEMVVKLEEIGFSGNRSPWESGQYQISDNSMARFPPGQDRARVTISMTPDPLREPDRLVSLLVRDIDDAESAFAIINLSLEDDDQRSFEASLGPNTVAFAVGQVSVREQDPAVQIDVVRFNPDQTTLTVEYVLREVTATQGEDYFVPGSNTVQFGPGQRSARILIPLVNDSTLESDEAFQLEMADIGTDPVNANIFRRIAVMIRDDDSNPE